jgi:hypothetical protein
MVAERLGHENTSLVLDLRALDATWKTAPVAAVEEVWSAITVASEHSALH